VPACAMQWRSLWQCRFNKGQVRRRRVGTHSEGIK
jgi:hypothetical protein